MKITKPLDGSNGMLRTKGPILWISGSQSLQSPPIVCSNPICLQAKVNPIWLGKTTLASHAQHPTTLTSEWSQSSNQISYLFLGLSGHNQTGPTDIMIHIVVPSSDNQTTLFKLLGELGHKFFLGCSHSHSG